MGIMEKEMETAMLSLSLSFSKSSSAAVSAAQTPEVTCRKKFTRQSEHGF